MPVEEADFRNRHIDTGLSYSQARKLIGLAISINRPVFLWGPPGVGKSSLCRELATQLSLGYIDIRMSLLNPVDLRGLPVAKDNVARWLTPSFLPQTPGFLINFDELNVAVPTVQTAAYQLILDRACGEYKMPDRCYIVACGNRENDRAVTFDMPAPLRNRFVHLELKPDLDSWKEWAYAKGIHPLVIGFLNWQPEALFKFDRATHTRSFPTPRSWEFVSDICHAAEGHVRDVAPLINGCLGNGDGIEFVAYADVAAKLPNIEKIVMEGDLPDIEKDNPGVCFALASGIVHIALAKVGKGSPEERARVGLNILRFVSRKFSTEFGTLCTKDLSRTPIWADKVKELMKDTPECREWVSKIGRAVLGE